MEPKHRPATQEELVAALAGRTAALSYDHFAREVGYYRNGAWRTRIVKTARSKVRMIDGVPHVLYRGKLEPIKATHCTLDDGKSFLWAYRLAALPETI